MITRLNLTIDSAVINEAKKYARSHGKSLSGLIETYLKSLVEKPEKLKDLNINPLVKSLWGSVKLDEEIDSYDNLVAEELLKKYRK